MIETLNGIIPPVHIGNELGMRIYHNEQYEDYAEHWHVAVEMIMPTSGEYVVVSGKERYELEEGDILVINSGVLHGIQAPPEGKREIMLFNPVLLYTMKELETLFAMTPPIYRLTAEKDPLIYPGVRTHLENILREYKGQKHFSEGIIYSELIQLFAEMGRKQIEYNLGWNQRRKVDDSEKVKGYLEIVIKACNYINLHYQEKLNLEDVADLVGFSKFHFSRVFKQYTNMTFYQYLSKRRVACAESLLYSTKMSVTEVAMNSGFSSMSSFDRTFRAINGIAPSEYRNILEGRDIMTRITKQ